MMENRTLLTKRYIKVSQFTLDDIVYKLNVHDKGRHILYTIIAQ